MREQFSLFPARFLRMGIFSELPSVYHIQPGMQEDFLGKQRPGAAFQMLRAMLFYKGLPVNGHVSALVGMDMVFAVVMDITVGEGNILAVPKARRAAFTVVDFGTRNCHCGAAAGIDSNDAAAKEGAVPYRDVIRPV